MLLRGKILNPGYRISPSSRRGASLIWGSLAVFISIFTLISGSEEPYLLVLITSIILTFPVVIMASRGHFGIAEWSFPTPVGLIFLFWAVGLLPSLIGAKFYQNYGYIYGPEAKIYGYLCYFVWFVLYTIAGGACKGRPVESTRISKNIFSIKYILLIFALFLGMVILIQDQSRLSSWSASGGVESLPGQSDSYPLAFYMGFVGIMPLIPIPFILRATGWHRMIGMALCITGILFLIIYSNRRLVLYDACILLMILNLMNVRIRVRVMLPICLAIPLLIGPLLWPIRVAMHNPELVGGDVKQIGLVISTLTQKLLLDDEFRKMASEAGEKNISEGRFNYADSYLATVQTVIDRGPRWSGSFVFGVIELFPSFLFPNKNEIKNELNIKEQIRRAGITDHPDFPMTPLQESIFQLGLFLGPMLGLFWGMIARILTIFKGKMLKSMAFYMFYLSVLLAFLNFESYFMMALPTVREVLIVSVLLGILERTLSRSRTQFV